MLGAVAVLALLEAGRRSARFASRIWFLAALAVGTYTAGQAMVTYYGDALFRSFSPHVSNQFFFFWIVPLLAAAAADPAAMGESFDWTPVLDFGQLVLLALALHLFVFGDASQWQAHAQQMGFLKWKVRLIRHVVVLGCLLCRAFVSDSRQIRALFLRLGIFFFSYTFADAIYLYAAASRNTLPGTWLDLLWSVPRLVAVVLALTWNRPDEIETRRSVAGWRRRCMVLYWAPVAVPLVVLALSSRMLSSAPAVWAGLTMTAFGIASVRLLVTQFRQEQVVERLHGSNNLLHSIIEGTSEAIYLKDSEGRYLLINSAGARKLSRSPEKIVGKTDHELFSPDSVEPILASDREVLSSGQALTSEDTVTAAGVTRTFLSTKNPYRDPQGRVAGVLGVSLDITERRRVEDQLRRAATPDCTRPLFRGIAHHFNQPLTLIKGYTQHALSQPQDQHHARDYT